MYIDKKDLLKAFFKNWKRNIKHECSIEFTVACDESENVDNKN